MVALQCPAECRLSAISSDGAGSPTRCVMRFLTECSMSRSHRASGAANFGAPRPIMRSTSRIGQELVPTASVPASSGLIAAGVLGPRAPWSSHRSHARSGTNCAAPIALLLSARHAVARAVLADCLPSSFFRLDRRRDAEGAVDIWGHPRAVPSRILALGPRYRRCVCAALRDVPRGRGSAAASCAAFCARGW